MTTKMKDQHAFSADTHSEPSPDTNHGMLRRPDSLASYLKRRRNLKLGLLIAGYLGFLLLVGCTPFTTEGFAQLQKLAAGLAMLNTIVVGILIHQSAKREILEL